MLETLLKHTVKRKSSLTSIRFILYIYKIYVLTFKSYKQSILYIYCMRMLIYHTLSQTKKSNWKKKIWLFCNLMTEIKNVL